ncbi:DUF7424 family protein [Haemophilus haemolyticus]|uniref:DUF7424 domain-containing protein n=1 Tax=Haemophilus haemolyticus TaxID=726 RepID=A0A852PWN3_HAEHA|nr:hypothetical protein [Haemophilus haemolyticus]NYA27892.1 hypothetical protein [Haemophilus haemolyticus]
MKKTFIALSSLCLLAGCKVDMTSSVGLAELQKDDISTINTELSVEVINCNDFEDSRRESKELSELKVNVPKVFRNAEFVECYKKKMESFAIFKVPVTVGKQKPSDFDIHFGSGQNSLFFIAASQQFRDKLAHFQKRNLTKLDMKINTTVVNNTQQSFKFKLDNIYLNGKPEMNSRFVYEVNPGEKIPLQLSNVATDGLLRTEQHYGGVIVMYREDK